MFCLQFGTLDGKVLLNGDPYVFEGFCLRCTLGPATWKLRARNRETLFGREEHYSVSHRCRKHYRMGSPSSKFSGAVG